MSLSLILHLVSTLLIGVVAALHFWFLTLEMFFWRKPLGLRSLR